MNTSTHSLVHSDISEKFLYVKYWKFFVSPKPMQWRLTTYSVIKSWLTSPFATWTLYYTRRNLAPRLLMLVSLVVLLDCCRTHPEAQMWALSFVTLVALCNPGQFLMWMKCLRIQFVSLATTSAFITGTSASLSSCCKKARYRLQSYSRLLRGYAMARTQLSTRAQSARFSDL